MTEAKTGATYRPYNHLDGEVTCSGCKALIARIAELETDLAKARSERDSTRWERRGW
jgi:hypothetical protein